MTMRGGDPAVDIFDYETCEPESAVSVTPRLTGKWRYT